MSGWSKGGSSYWGVRKKPPNEAHQACWPPTLSKALHIGGLVWEGDTMVSALPTGHWDLGPTTRPAKGVSFHPPTACSSYSPGFISLTGNWRFKKVIMINGGAAQQPWSQRGSEVHAALLLSCCWPGRGGQALPVGLIPRLWGWRAPGVHWANQPCPRVNEDWRVLMLTATLSLGHTAALTAASRDAGDRGDCSGQSAAPTCPDPKSQRI